MIAFTDVCCSTCAKRSSVQLRRQPSCSDVHIPLVELFSHKTFLRGEPTVQTRGCGAYGSSGVTLAEAYAQHQSIKKRLRCAHVAV
eukprot:3901385-Amphidinium_carterae.2